MGCPADEPGTPILQYSSTPFFIHVFSKPARRSAARKSFSTSAKPRPAIEGRATRTSSTGGDSSYWWSRKLSRSKRRARLRSTAPPMRRLVTTPSFGDAPSDSRRQLAMRQPRASRSPSRRKRAKSRFCPSREARPSRRRPGSGDWCGMRRLYRCQAFASGAAAVPQRGAAAFCGFAGKKPVLPLAADFRRLILAFHKFKFRSIPRGKLHPTERGRIAMKRLVSRRGWHLSSGGRHRPWILVAALPRCVERRLGGICRGNHSCGGGCHGNS